MRLRITIAALLVASMATPSQAVAASATSLPAYHLVMEYDVGLSTIQFVDVDGDRLYAESVRRDESWGRVARFVVARGERLWRQKLFCPGWNLEAYRSVALVQEKSCSESSPGSIHGINASNGGFAFWTDGISGVVAGDMAFLTNNYGEDYSTISVWGYSLPKGRVRWEYGPFPRDRRFDVIAGGSNTVEVSNWQAHTVTALDAKNGHELWTTQFGDVIVFPDGAQSGGLVLLTACPCGPAASPESVVALDESTGAFVWGASGELETVHGGVAYVNDGGALTALRVSDGAELWSTPGAVDGSSDPQVGGGIVWVRVFSTSGVWSVKAYDASTGAFLGSKPWSRVVGFLGDTVLASRDDGRVLAYAPT